MTEVSLLRSEPDDIDAVILLPPDFQHQIKQGIEAALELEEMILTRRPEEIFAVRKTRLTGMSGLSFLVVHVKPMDGAKGL